MIVQSIRGMNDILPDKTNAWQCLEAFLRDSIQSYGYQEIRFPYLENTALFKRAIGEATDIVEKEMYTFLDKNDESVTLRPEGTAGCVRACIQNNLLYHQTQKLWYLGPMFRYERPQKGRYRQFHQCGVEAYGFADTDIEFEILLMTAHFWRALNLSHTISLEINTLGTLEERLAYRQILIDYFKKHHALLDEDSQKRLERNPLRILDSKNPTMQELIEAAPQLLDHLGKESADRFNKLCQQLNKAVEAGLLQPFKINPRLVRGLDYYSHTVFEWVSNDLGAQGTVCAGGRYDSLVAQLSEKNEITPAFGFGMGLERLLLLLENTPDFQQNLPAKVDVFCILLGEQAETEGRLWIEQWRADVSRSRYRIEVNCGGNIKNQMKKADKSGAQIALILGDEEMHTQTVGVKFLRGAYQPQKQISQVDIATFLIRNLHKIIREENREYLSH